MRADALSDAFRAVGARLEQVFVTEFPERMTFVMTLVDQARITVERDENREVLVFIGELGIAPESRAQAMSNLLMTMNTIWGPTGGLRFGRDADGAFQMLWDLPYRALDTQTLGALTESFIDRTRYWTEVVRRGIDPAAVAEGEMATDEIIRA
ncbi:MAG: type III secretion system chaperone [Pseudomonadota bacterium]